MRQRTAIWFAWGTFAVAALIACAGLLLLYLNRNSPWTYSEVSRLVLAVEYVAFLLMPAIGAWLVVRRPDSPIGWLFCAGGLFVLVLLASLEYFVYAHVTRPETPGAAWSALAHDLTHFPTLLPVALLLLLFPDGRLVSPAWRPVAWLVVLASAASAGAAGLASELCLVVEGNVDEFACPPNPVALPNGLGEFVSSIDWIGWLLMPVAVTVSAFSLLVRFRRAGRLERQQIKWFASAGVLVAGSGVTSVFTRDLEGTTGEIVYGVNMLVLAFSIAAIPFAAAFAILRYRLYEIDRIINRTITYALLTAGLAIAYAGAIVGLQALLRPMAGGNDLAIVVTTLLVAALFFPARRRVQNAVDRRFNRRHYDAARTVESFASRLRQEVDLDSLRDELLRVVDETMQPTQVSLWLRDRNAAGSPVPYEMR
jgi:hypothetical protein